MSERVQLLLSDRILGMTLVPEGRVWNYGIGLTQSWSPNISYAMTLDTPLLFWAEEHRPTAFLTVSRDISSYQCIANFFVFLSSQISSKAKTVLTLKIALPKCLSRCCTSIVVLFMSLCTYFSCYSNNLIFHCRSKSIARRHLIGYVDEDVVHGSEMHH